MGGGEGRDLLRDDEMLNFVHDGAFYGHIKLQFKVRIPPNSYISILCVIKVRLVEF